MKKRLLYFLVPVIIIGIAYFMLRGGSGESEKDIFVDVKKGPFRVEITTTGELEARNSVQILGPMGLRNARIYNVTIERIVPEGTVVKRGDFIASLDRSELNERIRDRSLDMDQRLSDYTQAKLDSAINLRKLRDELINRQYTVDERKLILEQSQFEPPATIKQNELNYDKAVRELEQAKVNYGLERQKAVEQVKKAYSRYLETQAEMEFLDKLVSQMTVMAPEPGMVIYARDQRGNRLSEGSTISSWDPTVATLPDLTTMNSKTYVNEVDIRQIKVGQQTIIGLDAFPEKRLTGKVVSVANIGEQKANSDAKVFEVMIQLNEEDTTLRPAMTTSNMIIATEISDAISVPLEALHTQGDSLTYVYKKSGLATIKQEVNVGLANANEAVIESGLAPNDRIMLSIPNKSENKKLVLLNETQPVSSLE